jgi:hypothetical protein
MRKPDNSNSVRYGRLSIDDIKNRVPAKKDLFVICAAGKLTLCFTSSSLIDLHQYIICVAFISCC